MPSRLRVNASPPCAMRLEKQTNLSWRSPVQVRKAKLPDASNIYHLVNSLSSDGTLLRRGFAEICENVRDFTVAETEDGDFLGCGALHLYGPHLAEVRSIVVEPDAQSQGAGSKLLDALIDEAEDNGVNSICL